MKKPIAFIISSVVILCALFFLYFFIYRGTPLYSVKQIQSSIQNHDWTTFQRWVDVDAFISSFAENYKSTANSSDFSEGLSKLLGSTIITAGKEELRKYIENPSAETNNIIFGQIFSLEKNNSLKVAKEGKLATIAIPQKSLYFDTTLSFFIVFRKESNKYRLIGVKGLDEVEKNKTKLYENYKIYYNAPMRARIDSSVSVAITDRKKGCINWSGDYCLEDGVDVTTNIVNKTEKTIKDINFQITYFDKEHYGHLFNLLPPHKSISQTGTYKYNQFDEDDKLFLYSDINNMHITIDNVVFENGDTLKTDDYPPMPKQPITTKNISTPKL